MLPRERARGGAKPRRFRGHGSSEAGGCEAPGDAACGIFHKHYLLLALHQTDAMPTREPGKEREETERSALAASGKYAGLGLQMAAAIGFFLWLGWKADHALGWTPVLTILGAFVGAGGGFYSVYRLLMSDNQARGEPDR